MLAVFKNETSCPQIRALHDIIQFHKIGMIQRFQYVILSSDFVLLDGNENFDGNSFVGSFVGSLEHVGILSSPQF